MKKFVIALTATLGLLGQATLHSQQVRSANLTSVSATLSTPRLSFVGKLASGNSVGSSLITITTTANGASSTSSAELAEGDVVLIGDGGTANTYTVASASATNSTFSIKTPNYGVLQSGNADSGDAVIATRSGSVTLRFTTATAIPNGSFQILIPASANSSGRTDGIPDQDGFDFSNSTPTVTCPSDVSSTYDFVTGTATASAVTLAGVTYHAYECQYSGNGASSTAFDGSSQGTISISSVINPSPKTNHVQGNADIYKFIVRHLDSTNAAIDQTTISVGNIEAVRVTATVPPQITFSVLGVASGATACGQTTDVTTTATTVPFGEVSISSFSEAAHALSVSTNATNGFAVTAIANDQLGLNGNACVGAGPTFGNPCIRDSGGDNSTMTSSTSDEWNTASNKGFAYSLQDPNASTTEAFAYNESSRTFSARKFADAENSDSAQTIFSSTTVADNQNVYVCYRIIVGSTQQAGNYENTLTYRATATF